MPLKFRTYTYIHYYYTSPFGGEACDDPLCPICMGTTDLYDRWD